MGIGLVRVPTAQEKQGKWPKIFCQGKNTRNLEILPNTGNLFAEVVNSLIPKVKKIVIFAANISLKSALCML